MVAQGHALDAKRFHRVGRRAGDALRGGFRLRGGGTLSDFVMEIVICYYFSQSEFRPRYASTMREILSWNWAF